jgi:3-mercaptopyruvate sulfurtransferase SseA
MIVTRPAWENVMKIGSTVALAMLAGFGCGIVPAQTLHAQAKPPVYYAENEVTSAEDRKQKAEERRQKAEERRQKAEERYRKAEERSRKAEERYRKEDGRQRFEDRSEPLTSLPLGSIAKSRNLFWANLRQADDT